MATAAARVAAMSSTGPTNETPGRRPSATTASDACTPTKRSSAVRCTERTIGHTRSARDSAIARLLAVRRFPAKTTPDRGTGGGMGEGSRAAPAMIEGCSRSPRTMSRSRAEMNETTSALAIASCSAAWIRRDSMRTAAPRHPLACPAAPAYWAESASWMSTMTGGPRSGSHGTVRTRWATMTSASAASLAVAALAASSAYRACWRSVPSTAARSVRMVAPPRLRTGSSHRSTKGSPAAMASGSSSAARVATTSTGPRVLSARARCHARRRSPPVSGHGGRLHSRSDPHAVARWAATRATNRAMRPSSCSKGHCVEASDRARLGSGCVSR